MSIRQAADVYVVSFLDIDRNPSAYVFSTLDEARAHVKAYPHFYEDRLGSWAELGSLTESESYTDVWYFRSPFGACVTIQRHEMEIK